ncbi:MAG: macrolide transporter ATP-binding/permease protein, partial [Verrucomicrobiales bacterium]|nr:macrolide transporter ATP-binding/permease protein [Verrucomicrobiales bacterium]
MNNLRSAIRQLVKYPGLTLLAVLTLAMGTGAITAIFSVVKAVLLQPLPFEKPNDLVVVWANNPHQGLQGFGTSYPNFLDWKLQNHSFVDLAASSPDSFNVTIGTEPERVRGASVSANFFSVFGVNPILGRSFLPGEDSLGRDNVVLLGQPFWEQHFGGNSNIIGQTMTLNSKVVTIVGVMPRQFHFPFSSEVWVPVTLDNKSKESRGYWWLNVVGRLKSGSGIANAQADMDTVSRRLAQQYPETHSGWGAKLVGIHEQTVGSARDEILLLFMAGVFVLLIACANVANLQLIRTSERHQEFGIRTAIGATRNDIVVQILTENAFLFALGGLCGFLIAAFSIEYFLKFVPSNIPRIRDVHVDFPLFLFTLLISLANGFIFGLLPALKRPAMDLYSVLKGAGKGGIGDGSSSRVRQFLIV